MYSCQRWLLTVISTAIFWGSAYAQPSSSARPPSVHAVTGAPGTMAPMGASAATPPMGWNSYNSFGSAVHEDEIRANADYMAAHLLQAGWQYIVVDFLWSYDNPPGSLIGNPFQKRLQDGAYIPWLPLMNGEGSCPMPINSLPQPGAWDLSPWPIRSIRKS